MQNKMYLCEKQQAMEDLGFTQGLTTIFGFLAVCIAMIWKVVSDKKDDSKVKEMHEKITKILEYITTEKEKSNIRQDEMQKQIEQNTKAISEMSGILEKISAKLNAKPKKNNQKRYKDEN